MQGVFEQNSILVVLDGDCAFCQSWVPWLIQRNPKGQLFFVENRHPWIREQEPELRNAVKQYAGETLIVWSRGKAYREWAAIRLVLGQLKLPWRALGLMDILPGSWLNAAYRLVSRRRYAWFGTARSCYLPEPEQRYRFPAFNLPSS